MENKIQHVQVPDPSGLKDLKPIDRLVYANMRRFMNKDTYTCYPSLSTLTEKCGVTKPTVCSSIKRLVKYGYIEILPEKMRTNNIYKFKKLIEDFERFTPEFLDDTRFSPGEKSYMMGLQSQSYKSGGFAITTYSNEQLAQKLNMSERGVRNYNTSLKTKEVLSELRTCTHDQAGFNKVAKALDLEKIGQAVLFEVAINHEDRITQLEKMVSYLIKENEELKKITQRKEAEYKLE